MNNMEVLQKDVSYYVRNILKNKELLGVTTCVAVKYNTDIVDCKDSEIGLRFVFIGLVILEEDLKVRFISQVSIGVTDEKDSVIELFNKKYLPLFDIINQLNIVSIELGGSTVGGAFKDVTTFRKYYRRYDLDTKDLKIIDTEFTGTVKRDKFVSQHIELVNYTDSGNDQNDYIVALPICAQCAVANMLNELNNNDDLDTDLVSKVLTYSDYGIKHNVYKTYVLGKSLIKDTMNNSLKNEVYKSEKSADDILDIISSANWFSPSMPIYEHFKNTKIYDTLLRKSGIGVRYTNGRVDKDSLEQLKLLLKEAQNLNAGLYSGVSSGKVYLLIRKLKTHSIIGLLVDRLKEDGEYDSTDSRHAIYFCGFDEKLGYLFVYDPNDKQTDNKGISLIHNISTNSDCRHVYRKSEKSCKIYSLEFTLTAKKSNYNINIIEETENLVADTNIGDTNESYMHNLDNIQLSVDVKYLSHNLIGSNTFDIENNRELITLAILIRFIERGYIKYIDECNIGDTYANFSELSVIDLYKLFGRSLTNNWLNIQRYLIARGYSTYNGPGNVEYTENISLAKLNERLISGEWAIILCNKYDSNNILVGTYSLLCVQMLVMQNLSYLVCYDYLDGEIKRVMVDISGKNNTGNIDCAITDTSNTNNYKYIPKKLILGIRSPFKTRY